MRLLIPCMLHALFLRVCDVSVCNDANLRRRVDNLIGDAISYPRIAHGDDHNCASTIFYGEVVSYLGVLSTLAIPSIRTGACETRGLPLTAQPPAVCTPREFEICTADTNTNTPAIEKMAIGTYETSYAPNTMAKEFTPLQPAVDADLSLAQYLSRPVFVGTYTVPATGTVTTTFPLREWLLIPAIAQKVSSYTMINCTLHVRVDISFNPHYYGLARVSLLRDTTAIRGHFGLYRASCIPGEFQDFSLSNSVLLSGRVSNTGLGVRIQGTAAQLHGTRDAMSMIYSSITPVGRDDDVAPGDLTYKLYVWATDASLSGATAYDAAGDSVKSNSNVRLSLRDANLVGTRPAGVARALGAASQPMGWGKDRLDPSTSRISNTLVTNMTTSAGRDSAVPLTLDPNAQTTVDLSRVDDSSVDKLSLDYLTNLPGMVGYVDWSTTDAVGAQLSSFAVAPGICALYGTNALSPPPVAGCSFCFDKWTGSMKYRIKASATPFHRGKLLVAYFPNTVTETLPSLEDITSRLQHEIIDVAAGIDKEFIIRWSNDSPYLPIDRFAFNVPPHEVNCNGSLRIFCMDKLSATAPGATLHMTVWVSAGPDLDFQHVGGTLSECSAAGDAVPKAFAEEEPSPTTTVFGSFDIDAAHIANTFGERTLSMRTVLQRYHTWLVAGMPVSNTPTLYSPVIRTTYPVAPFLRYTDSIVNHFGNGVASDYYLNPMTYVMAAFAGYRGGIRHKVYMLTPTNGSMTANTVSMVTKSSFVTNVTNLKPWSYLNGFASVSPGYALDNIARFAGQYASNGAVMTCGTGSFPLIADVEVRSDIGWTYTYSGLSNLDIVVESGFDVVTFLPPSASGVYTGAILGLTSIADDFVPVQFVGFPAVQQNGPGIVSGTPFPNA